MRIATWNLEGRWSREHATLVEALEADLLLLTEVPDTLEVSLHLHRCDGVMSPGRRWAAIASRTPPTPLPDPHGASALAEVDGLVVACSVLPWRTCGAGDPWVGTDTGARTGHAVDAVVGARPTLWGGDWNHELTGRSYAGTRPGRSAITRAVADLGLVVPTADAPHRAGGASIDHVAVPAGWRVTGVGVVSAVVQGRALSDHDAFVVEAEPG